jgi:alpha/beta superfamily hydrolase
MAADGVELEALWNEPPAPRAAVLLCHPHPLHGGTMRAPLMEGITARLLHHQFAVLRFNFRGVGSSAGAHESGMGELLDIDAAMAAVRERHPDVQHGIAGWSFGGSTSLVWTADRKERLPWVGVAPPVSSESTPALPDPASLPTGRRTFILGDRDQFVSTEDVCRYAKEALAEVHILPGSDHFFYFREERVGDLIADALIR